MTDMPELKPCERVTMWRAWMELNAIRARDGVPYTHMGYKCSVDEEYFSSVVDDLQACLGEYAQPWEPPPVYTRPTPPADAMPTEAIALVDDALTEMAMRHNQIKGNNAYLAFRDTIVPALHPAPVTDAQREALKSLDWLENRYQMIENPRGAIEHTVEALFDIRDYISRAALSAPVAQVDVEALIAAYWFINASEKELKEIGKDRVYWLKEFHRLCPSMPHLTPKTQEAEG